MVNHRFPLPPSANRYWRYVRGRVIVSPEAQDYKTTVAMLAKCARVTMLTGPVVVTVAIYRERKSGDLDNFLKVLLDALQGVFYRNDSQIRELRATLHEDRHEPRCEVTVTDARTQADEWSQVLTPDRADSLST